MTKLQLAPTSVDLVLDESSLLAAMLAGDENAFEAFSDEYLPRLYRFVLTRLRGDHDLAQEIVQKTVCKAIRKLDTFRGQSTLFTWLCACARSEIAMHFRSAGRAPESVELREELSIGPASTAASRDGEPEQRLLQKETVEMVHSALNDLPSHYAQILEWKYIDHIAVKEIALRLSATVKATESLLTRARSSFRSTFDHLRGEQPNKGPAPILGRMVAQK